MKLIPISFLIKFIIIFSGPSEGSTSSENEKTIINNQTSVINNNNYIESKRFGQNATEDKMILQNIENKRRDGTLLNSSQVYSRSPGWTGSIAELDSKQGIPRVKRTQRIQQRSLDDARDKDTKKKVENATGKKAKDEDVNKKDDKDEENDDPFKENRYIHIPVRAHWKIRSKKKIKRPQKSGQGTEATSKTRWTEPKPEADYYEIDPVPLAASSQPKNSPPCLPCWSPCLPCRPKSESSRIKD